jgi:hypothetical protein
MEDLFSVGKGEGKGGGGSCNISCYNTVKNKNEQILLGTPDVCLIWLAWKDEFHAIAGIVADTKVSDLKSLMDAKKIHAGENNIQTTYKNEVTTAHLRADGIIVSKVLLGIEMHVLHLQLSEQADKLTCVASQPCKGRECREPTR